MVTITDIQPQQRNKNRVNVFIEGEYAFAIERISALKFGIKIGAEVDSVAISNSVLDSESNIAFGKSIDYLSRANKTVSQMRQYLVGKGYSQQVVDITIDKLIDYKYLNDKMYAVLYTQSSTATKGARRIKQELAVKGISANIIESECVVDSQLSLDSATRLANKYMRNKDNDTATLAKLNRYLLSRGFEYDTVNSVVSSYKGEQEW